MRMRSYLTDSICSSRSTTHSTSQVNPMRECNFGKPSLMTMMVRRRAIISIAVIILCSPVLTPAQAFASRGSLGGRCFQRDTSLAVNSGDNDDPTESMVAKFADRIQNVFTNSPLNEGKKALVRAIAGDYDKEGVRAKLDGLIEEKPVLMLSFTTCPFCLKAKSVLDQKGVTYETVELDVETDGNAIRAEMADMIGRTSVPAIWIGGEFIGGCNDGPQGGVVKLDDTGELEQMLQGVGAM